MELNMENFGSMIDNVIAGICFFEYDKTGGAMTPFFVNEGLFRMLGYSRTQGMKFRKICRFTDRLLKTCSRMMELLMWNSAR